MGDKHMHKIAVIPGDGTGPEVVAEGMKVMEAAAKKFGFKYEAKDFDFSGQRYLKTGKLVDDSDIEELKKYSAIYLGAVGDPRVKPGIIEAGVLLKLRFALDQYINLRPVKLYNAAFCPLKAKQPQDIDFVVVRENSEGLYKGMGEFKAKGTKDEVAIQISYNTRKGVERCIRYAFEYCRKRNKTKKLLLCGKTNVLTYAWDLWQRVFNEVAKEYPDVATDYAHVDATTMWFVKNPEWFDVIVTDNMFGDIITDLGAMIQGGLGIAAGGNINPRGVSMFEPIGGSAPKYTGKNVINPLAAICAVGMMLENLGEIEAGKAIEAAVIKVANNKLKSLAAGKMGYSTTEVGDLVVKNL
ncbi:MAG: 3-isopropylmalate dehydrogenase [Candidatus Omnitrophica bacterium CG08_land_8_20_14_0_20_41_16]|uniref:3-isopropylmalate dehydrogenase n=1 Tax=Candidatus Sherwoodlollariibacterium unditelluris TaxID=1974757 RepID=A0A2G9YKK8_9BACT|nr:MAG: 3-isopropylmalate dehydrogenase [Candidatus Omnitrophica bacterium CG23_combo_of_CG06-09_8_20_14_all_41_10]PIS33682.1 MAG: 3-isopropylmalate dehydrogenase [Candidatus Omnitrophica bacterium CG08_land_8_20_14_0_20_41_16]